jgi:hypothetical protein
MYKLFVFCPDKEDIIYSIMEAASIAGAGFIGNYNHCGFFQKGTGNWKPLKGSSPAIGKVGKYSHELEVKIEMICPKEKASAVKKAIRKVNPYEEPEIDFVELIMVE